MGKVRSLPRHVVCRCKNHKNKTHKVIGRVLSSSTRVPRTKYTAVVLVKDASKKGERPYVTVYVHRLVVFAFLGEMSSRKRHVNHKNGKKHDNRIENLEVISCSENLRYSYTVLGQEYSTRKVDDRIFGEMVRLKKHGVSQANISRIFGLSPMTISRAVRRITLYAQRYDQRQK